MRRRVWPNIRDPAACEGSFSTGRPPERLGQTRGWASRTAQKPDPNNQQLIPTAINHDAAAHLRCVMEVRRAGVAMRPFQAVQQASTMAS